MEQIFHNKKYSQGGEIHLRKKLEMAVIEHVCVF
jgi:hypothetical protein